MAPIKINAAVFHLLHISLTLLKLLSRLLYYLRKIVEGRYRPGHRRFSCHLELLFPLPGNFCPQNSICVLLIKRGQKFEDRTEALLPLP